MEGEIYITCDNSHVLTRTTRASWMCNTCTNGFRDTESYYCSECDYDCCFECAMKKQVKQKYLRIVEEGFICQFGHPLQYSESEETINCASCKGDVPIRDGYTCKEKCMSFCYNCTDMLFRQQAFRITSEFKCFECHSLTLTYNIYGTNEFECNICKEAKNSTSDGIYHCYKCDFDLCYTCAQEEKTSRGVGFYIDKDSIQRTLNGYFSIFPNGIMYGVEFDGDEDGKWLGNYNNGTCSLTRHIVKTQDKMIFTAKLNGSKLAGTWELNSNQGYFELNFDSEFFSKCLNYAEGSEIKDNKSEIYYQNNLTLNTTKPKQIEAPSSRTDGGCRLCQIIEAIQIRKGSQVS